MVGSADVADACDEAELSDPACGGGAGAVVGVFNVAVPIRTHPKSVSRKTRPFLMLSIQAHQLVRTWMGGT